MDVESSVKYIVAGVAAHDGSTYWEVRRASDFSICAFHHPGGDLQLRSWRYINDAVGFVSRLEDGMTVDGAGYQIEWAPDDRRLH